MLLKDFIAEGSARLEALYPAPEARNIILLLCSERLGTSSYAHIVDPSLSVPQADLAGLEADFQRLCAGEPIQYVVGYADFFGKRFKVSPSVLIPRPETELLCSEAIDICKEMHISDRPVRILDLCTGSGCIAWTLALNIPGCETVAVDLSRDALDVAESQDFSEEIDKLGAMKPRFINADILDSGMLPGEGKFDLIVSNPPYIRESEKAGMRPNVLRYEPPMALFVPDSDPLAFYRAVAAQSCRLLQPAGTGLVEINEDLGSETAEVFSSSGFGNVWIKSDFFGKQRYVVFSK